MPMPMQMSMWLATHAAASVLILASAATTPAVVRDARSTASPPKAPRPLPPVLSAPLPGLPVVSRVRLLAGHDHVLVTEDVRLPAAETTFGEMRFFVAFGAPGAPRAFDARVGAASAVDEEPPDDDSLEPLTTGRAPRRPPHTLALFGPTSMSGALVSLPLAQLKRLASPENGALLRIRALHDAPALEDDGERAVRVRLGMTGGEPLAILRIEVGASEPGLRVGRASASLCGPEADAYPLAVTLLGAVNKPQAKATAPVLAVRHATDDLCVRYQLLGSSTASVERPPS